MEQLTASDTTLTNDMVGQLTLVWPNGEKLSVTQPNIVTGFFPAATLGLELISGRDAAQSLPVIGGKRMIRAHLRY